MAAERLPQLADPLGSLGQAVLDGLTDRVAVLGPDGVIVAVNARWRDVEFVEQHRDSHLDVGDHFVTRMRSVATRDDPVSTGMRAIADAVETVLAGQTRRVRLEWPSPVGPGRWDVVQVEALPDPGGALLLARDVSDRVLAETRLRHAVTHDRVTGLPNRARLRHDLEKLLAEHSGPVAVVHLDIDRFELLNARHGPSVADRVLAVLARRLTSRLAEDGRIGRSGDDSFTVVAAGDEAVAIDLAERLLSAISEPVALDGIEVALTASAGVAVSAPGRGRVDDLLRDADLATRRAKEAGRAQVVVASDEERIERTRRLDVEQGLRSAVARGELWLEYQPWSSLRDGTIVGAEALVRWTHPTLGVLAPDTFIGAAEETGAIRSLGEWVLGQACRDAADWRRRSGWRVGVSVNVSPLQLSDPDFASMVARCLDDAGLLPARLCVEVTETALVGNWELAERILHQLRSMGVRVAIDDFGTGYSSFAHLARLPLDVVKIAPALATGVASDPQALAVIEAVVALGRRLGLMVVAEGVEDDAARRVLAWAGCDAAQGYGCGRPMPADAFVEALRASQLGDRRRAPV